MPQELPWVDNGKKSNELIQHDFLSSFSDTKIYRLECPDAGGVGERHGFRNSGAAGAVMKPWWWIAGDLGVTRAVEPP